VTCLVSSGQPLLENGALAISNSAMLLVLDSLNEYTGLGFEDELASIKAWMRRVDEQTKAI
jgi:hypothetical protein